MTDSSAPDIIVGTETWLNSSIMNNEIFPPSVYEVERRDRPDGYGGVLIAVNKNLNSKKITANIDSGQVWVKINRKRKSPIIIGSVYRAPKIDLDHFLKLKEDTQAIINDHKNAIIWIGGDLNLPDIDWPSGKIVGNQNSNTLNEEFLSFLNENSLHQSVTSPTRRTNVLDLFVTNRPTLINRCEVIPGISDHEVVFVNINIYPARCKPVKRKIYLWNKANTDQISTMLQAYYSHFNQVFNSSTPIEIMWESFKSNCKSIIENNVPTKLSSSRFNQPWVNNTIKKLAKRKQRQFNRAKRSQKEKDWSRYKQLKDQQKIECKKAFNSYVGNKISPDINTKPKKFWSFIKSKKCDALGVSVLRADDGLTYTDSASKANIFNRQFESVFNKETSHKSFADIGVNITQSVSSTAVSNDGVLKQLNNLDIHKASGPDEIPARLLKQYAPLIAPILTKIYQNSIDQGATPKDCKKANVTPLFKKGDRSNASNYRPILLTCISCKIFIICSNVMDNLQSLNLLSVAQHGFRRKRSCESQLILVINELAKSLNNGDQIDVILLDFQKAFDKVPHEKLLIKLQQYGITG